MNRSKYRGRTKASRCIHFLLLAALLLITRAASPHGVPPPEVHLQRVPDNGIQPQVAVDTDGTVHLVYFKGDPAQGDLFYTRSRNGSTFADPVRVNSVPGSAVALGNIRGARIAVGRRNHVYVVWNGSQKLANPAEGRTPMLFSRLNAAGTAFEPQRNLIHKAYGLDGGGSVAAGRDGRVYVFWHAPRLGDKGEESRRVWMAQSLDDGVTFGEERIAWNQDTGVCSCCSLDAYVAPSGTVFVLFRAAHEITHRDMYLLESKDRGATFHGSDISKWDVGYCVMSAESFASGPHAVFAAWETEKQIHYSKLLPSAPATDYVISRSDATQKYPSLAVNRDGYLLVSWTEGMSWKRGGSLHWTLLNGRGEPTGNQGSETGVPAWSLVAAYQRPNGSFVILY